MRMAISPRLAISSFVIFMQGNSYIIATRVLLPILLEVARTHRVDRSRTKRIHRLYVWPRLDSFDSLALPSTALLPSVAMMGDWGS